MNGTRKYLVAAIAMATACVPLANAHDDGCKPVNGRFEATIVPPGVGHCPNVAGILCTAGRVWGGIKGQYQFVASGVVPAATVGGIPTAIFYAGQSTVFLKHGAIVVGTDSGTLDPPPGQGGFASLITFHTGASGQIQLRGDLDAVAGTTSGDYIGVMCPAP